MTDIFTNDVPATEPVATTTPAATQPQETEADQLLKTLVTEQGAPKYSSVAEGLKALVASQNHIKTLEAENASLRGEVANKKTLEEMVAALKAQKDEPASQTASPKNPEIDIDQLIEAKIQKKAEEARQAANISLIRDKVSKAFGEKASEVFYQKAEELGFDKAGINSLASSNPNAVLKLLGIAETPTPKVDTPATSTVNTATFSNPNKETKKSGMGYGDLMDSWTRIKQEIALKNNL